MSAILRRITFDAVAMSAATSTPVASSGTVRFRRQAGFLSGGQWVEPGHVDAAYAAGTFTAPLWLAVPDSGAATYAVSLDGVKYTIGLTAGAAVELSTLLLSAQVADVSAVDQLLSLYALLSAFDGVTITVDPVTGIISATAGGDVTQAELDAETVSRQTADVGLAADLDTEEAARIAHAARADNPHAVTAAQIGALTPAAAAALYQTIAAMTAYAQLAVANTFTKAQIIRGEATAELTRVLEVLASDLSSLLKVKVPNGYGSPTVEVNGANRTNQPALAITNAGAGLGILSVGIAGGGGYSEFASGGITRVYTNRNAYDVVQGTAFAGSASSPAHERSADTSWIARVIDRVNAPVGQTNPVADWQVNSVTKAKILPTGDVEIIDATAGVILKDRTTGTRYRLKVDGGVLGLEAA